jgi:uncharacterized membrane protein
MEQIIEYVALGLGVLAGLVILYGVVLGIIELVRAELHGLSDVDGRPTVFESIRYDIGFHLLLGLEFLIAGDVIRTIIRPSLEDLAILGGLVAVRTVISYFLGREMGYDGRKKQE